MVKKACPLWFLSLFLIIFINCTTRVYFDPQACREGGKWGFIDRTGEFIIQPQFDEALPFSEGLAAVKTDKTWGFIDKKGNNTIPPRFKTVGRFSNGRAMAYFGGYKGSIDSKGKFTFPSSDDQIIGDFSEGVMLVRVSGKPKQYDENTHNSLGQFHFINKNGDVVITSMVMCTRMFDFHDGLARFQMNTIEKKRYHSRYGYIDKTGQQAIEPRFVAARDFSEGLAAVNIGGVRTMGPLLGGRWGFIDKTGNISIPARYADVGRFSGGVAPVDKGFVFGPWIFFHRWGYIDPRGKWAIQPKFTGALPFSEGLAGINKGGIYDFDERLVGGTWGFIDEKGKMAIPAGFTAVGEFSEGLAPAEIGGHWEYYTKVAHKGSLLFKNPGTARNFILFFFGGVWGIMSYFIFSWAKRSSALTRKRIASIFRIYPYLGIIMIIAGIILHVQPPSIIGSLMLLGFFYFTFGKVFYFSLQKEQAAEKEAGA